MNLMISRQQSLLLADAYDKTHSPISIRIIDTELRFNLRTKPQST